MRPCFPVTVAFLGLTVACRGSGQPIQLTNAFPSLTFTAPVFLTHSNDGTNRIFVVQQNGFIRVFPNDSAATDAETFLDISTRIVFGGERGLLGLAFHPEYATNGYFFVNYTTTLGLGGSRTVISRFSVAPGTPNNADPLSEFIILEIPQPFVNHNGGMILFGSDGYLYIGMGDGGSGGDPQSHAQNLNSLLGKMLRIDVNSASSGNNYAIPPDNPLAGNILGFREEIWAWGFRNPWRFSLDPPSGQIWAGDVGQSAWEEIDIVESGKNYGWRCYEGNAPFNPTGCGSPSNYTFPVKVYARTSPNCAVTGGYVYRGSRIPDLVGAYIYADYCSGRIHILRHQNGQIIADSLLIDAPFFISSFGVDQHDELFICNYSGGSIQRFVASPLTHVEGENFNSPVSYTLEQNFPNPFNPITTIRYYIKEREHVVIKVHDLLGKGVLTLVDDFQEPGTKEVVFDASGLSSGAYYYHIQAGSFTDVKRMMVLR